MDEKGDVLEWGLGFTSSPDADASPQPTLRNHDIVKLCATPFKIFALSRKGEVLVFPSTLARQRVNEEERKSHAAWWKVWWGRDAGTDVEKLRADSPLARGEKYVH